MEPTLTRRFRIYVGYTDEQLANDPFMPTRAAQTLLNIAGIDNFTQYKEKGYWNRISETAIIFEIISNDRTMPMRIHNAASMLKRMPGGKQEAVLVTTDLIESYII